MGSRLLFAVAICGALALFASSGNSGRNITESKAGAKSQGGPAVRSSKVEFSDIGSKAPVLPTANGETDGNPACMVALNDGEPLEVMAPGWPDSGMERCVVHGVVDAVSPLEDELQGRATSARGSGGNGLATPTFRPDRSDAPLTRLGAKSAEACDYRNLSLKRGTHTLQPGVYCGGIVALNAADIRLESGIYIFKNGPLILGGTTTLAGENVGIHFQGDGAVFGFGTSTRLELTAPDAGPMRGILFFQDRSAFTNQEFVIRSFDAQSLFGTIYLPGGKLIVETVDKPDHPAAGTRIIANQIEFRRARAQLSSQYSEFDTTSLAASNRVKRVVYAGE